MTITGRASWLEGHAAVDLGTARVRAVVLGHPVIIDQPAGLTSRDETRWPVRHGIVVDTATCARLVDRALRAVTVDAERPLRKVLLGVPVSASPAERAAAAEAVRRAAGCPVAAVEEPLAAAVGCGLDVTDPRPQLLVDIGAGIIEAVVIRDAAVVDAVALQLPAPAQPVLPSHVQDRITAMTAELLARLPSAMRGSARERGLLLTGGGACQPRLAARLCSRLGLVVSSAPEPAHATVRGLARLCLSPLAALVALPTA
ncbi:rod shape-determining protein [Nonomuraea sp. NPDC049152]|uniref:rod shape-determining protein n=1 Tax=Nonomuraea sp. NPDC049152 TaxID=3154350 RepID=UPI00340A4656